MAEMRPEMGKSQITKDLYVVHGKNLGFYLKFNGKPWRVFSQGRGPVSAGPAGHNQRCFAWPSARLQQDLRQDQRQGFTPAVSCDILDLSKATVSPRPVTSPVIGWG